MDTAPLTAPVWTASGLAVRARGTSQPEAAAGRAPRSHASRVTRKQRRELWLGLAFVSPWLLGFLVVHALPRVRVAVLLVHRLQRRIGAALDGLRNYADLFADPCSGKPCTTRCTWPSSASGLVDAQPDHRHAPQPKIRFQGVFRTLYFLPSVVPAVAAALLWRWFLNPDYGPINESSGNSA